MGRLLNELLVLARADAGHEQLTRERLYLDELVNDVLGAMAPLAEARQVRLAGEVAGPLLVEGDQTRLTQLIVNLVENAIKYTAAGGQVSVTVERQASRAVIRVADTGIGIPAEHLPHVFERFYRVDTSRSRSEGGEGLGLAICWWVAQAHGGSIQVHSTPGKGSTFTVFLPASLQESQQARRPNAPPRPALSEQTAAAR